MVCTDEMFMSSALVLSCADLDGSTASNYAYASICGPEYFFHYGALDFKFLVWGLNQGRRTLFSYM